MSDQVEFQKSFDQLKSIVNEFKSTQQMSLDDIETKFKAAQEAYGVCKNRISQIKEMIESSQEK